MRRDSAFPSTGGVPLSQSRMYRVRVNLAHPIYNPDTGQQLDGKKVFWTGKTRPPRSGHPGSGWAEFVLADDQETRFFLRPNLVVPDESFGPSAQYRRNPQHSDAVPFASVKVGQRFYTAPGIKEAVLGGPRAWFEKVSESEAVHIRSRGRFPFTPTHQVVVEEVGSEVIGVPKMPQYDAAAVDAAIASSRRAGRGISGREARAIHGLMKGWRKNPSEQQNAEKEWVLLNGARLDALDGKEVFYGRLPKSPPFYGLYVVFVRRRNDASDLGQLVRFEKEHEMRAWVAEWTGGDADTRHSVIAVWATINPKGRVELRRGHFGTALYAVSGPGFAGYSNAQTDEAAIRDVEKMAVSGFEGRVKGKVIRIQ